MCALVRKGSWPWPDVCRSTTNDAVSFSSLCSFMSQVLSIVRSSPSPGRPPASSPGTAPKKQEVQSILNTKLTEIEPIVQIWRMDNRELFAERLKAAMAQAGYEPRPVVLEREFNLRYWGKPVTFQAVRRWLRGGGYPRSGQTAGSGGLVEGRSTGIAFWNPGGTRSPGRKGGVAAQCRRRKHAQSLPQATHAPAPGLA